jgi:hypothetical protein
MPPPASSPRLTDPGPGWRWACAWSLQGAGVMGVRALGIESGNAQLMLTGVVAGVPLLALFWILSRRETPEPQDS